MFVIYHDAYESRDTMQVFVSAVDLGDDDITCHEGRQIVFAEPYRRGRQTSPNPPRMWCRPSSSRPNYRALVGRSND